MLTGERAYAESRRIWGTCSGAGFYPLLMAALRAADSQNVDRIRAAFPDVVAELQARYNAPGGVLTPEQEARIEAMQRPPVHVLLDAEAQLQWEDKRVPETFDNETGLGDVIEAWLDRVEKRMREQDPAGHRWLFEGGHDPDEDNDPLMELVRKIGTHDEEM
jgi:hypothetical protein